MLSVQDQTKGITFNFSDMKDKYPDQSLKVVFRAMNWITICNSWKMMTGQKDIVNQSMQKTTATQLQSH